MKKKITYLLLLILSVSVTPAIAGCDDNDKDDVETVIKDTELPPDAKSFLTTYYPGVSITRTVKDVDHGRTYFDVLLSNHHEVTFDEAGRWTDIDAPATESVPGAVIPAVIQAYLNANYPGAVVNEIERDAAGYQLDLTDGRDLYFDADGNFVRADR